MIMSRSPLSLQQLTPVSKLMSLENRVALITGAAGGIGKATANALAQLHADIAIADVSGKAAELARIADEIHRTHGIKCLPYCVDISDEHSVERLFDAVESDLGTVSVLHNNAGIGIWPDHAALPTESWEKMVAINLTGSFFMARCCADRLLKAGQTGSVVTTASMSSHIVNAGPGYSATKAGVRHMSAALAIEFAKVGIRFNTVSYGYILSGMHSSSDAESLERLYQSFESHTPMGRMGNLDDVVGAVVFLATDLSAFMTGSDVLVDGGFSIGRLF